MHCCSLSSVKQRITLGAPLPFNVRNADRTLLLARGQLITSSEQLQSLLSRGALVDMDELKPRSHDTAAAPPEALPALWDQTFDRVGLLLRSGIDRDFLAALDRAAEPVTALIERDPDLAIFQIVRQQTAGGPQYGVAHSMHVAIASRLAAQRLGWDQEAMDTVFKAALTMNISMLELQGRLSQQPTPLTSAQREAIVLHPARSVAMLHDAGVANRDWLDAVAQHHEAPDGSGYPERLTEVSEMAAMLRRADIYTAKLSARATRGPLKAHDAARIMFVEGQGHPMIAAMVKAFGIYPPGCCVRLASGEVGLVVRRGNTSNAPIVAVVQNKRGEPMMEPARRNTESAEHAVIDVLNERSLKVRVSRAQLAALGNA